MRKMMLMGLVAIMTAMSVNAQSDEPRHEIGISYGAGITLIGDGIGNGVGTGLFDTMVGRKWTNSKEFGTLGVEYFYHLNNPRVAVGGVLTYAQYGEDVEYNNKKEGERTRRYISLMPSVKYYYVSKKHFGLYSKLAAGPMLITSKSEKASNGNTDSDSKLSIMFQASLLGLEAGSQNVRAFVELGAGEQGIILGGLKFKF